MDAIAVAAAGYVGSGKAECSARVMGAPGKRVRVQKRGVAAHALLIQSPEASRGGTPEAVRFLARHWRGLDMLADIV